MNPAWIVSLDQSSLKKNKNKTKFLNFYQKYSFIYGTIYVTLKIFSVFLMDEGTQESKSA